MRLNCSKVLSILGKSSLILRKNALLFLTCSKRGSSCSYSWENLRFVFFKKLFLKKVCNVKVRTKSSGSLHVEQVLMMSFISERAAGLAIFSLKD